MSSLLTTTLGPDVLSRPISSLRAEVPGRPACTEARRFCLKKIQILRHAGCRLFYDITRTLSIQTDVPVPPVSYRRSHALLTWGMIWQLGFALRHSASCLCAISCALRLPQFCARMSGICRSASCTLPIDSALPFRQSSASYRSLHLWRPRSSHPSSLPAADTVTNVANVVFCRSAPCCANCCAAWRAFSSNNGNFKVRIP